MVLFGATLIALRMVAASTRVIGWVVAAATLASLMHPLVALLSRFVKRGLAVLFVVLLVVASVGLVGFGFVSSVVRQTRHVQESAPAAAAKLETSKRYGDVARQWHLQERTRRFVDSVPQRLQGGDTASVLRSAATRGVAFLATSVLTLFFLLYGPRLAASASLQITDEDRRERVQRVVGHAYDRTVRYACGTALIAVAAGLFSYLVCTIADVPGAVAFAVWVALWDIVPVVGAFVGALPIALLAGVNSWDRAVAVLVAFACWQVLEHMFLQRRVEQASIRLGPFATVIAMLIGLELYGLGGALVAVLALCLAVAGGDELLPR